MKIQNRLVIVVGVFWGSSGCITRICSADGASMQRFEKLTLT